MTRSFPTRRSSDLLEHDGRICGVETDKLLPALRHERRPVERTLSDKIGLRLADSPAKPDVIGSDRAVGFLSDDDIALLGAQYVHRFGAIGRETERLTTGPDRFPHLSRLARGEVDLEAEFAGAADPHQQIESASCRERVCKYV